MLKSIFFLFIVIWIINDTKSEASKKDFIDEFRKDNSRYWLISCTLSGCSLAFNSCMNCFGERGCKSCISLSKPECAECADDIFNKDDLEIINGNEYLICDSQDPIQSRVCHFYCRGQFAQSGQCIRENNLPICKCFSDFGSSTDSTVTTQTTQPANTTTTSQSTTTPNKPSIFFNGTVKQNISISDHYRRILPLPNGDLVRGSGGNLIEIWDLQKGIIKRNLTSVYSWPWVFGLLSNGDLVAGFRNNKTILVWDLNITIGEPLKRIIQTNEYFDCLTVLKNDDLAIGQTLVNNPWNLYDIIIRNSQTGLIKNKLVGHTFVVNQIIELPNGNLVSCSSDNTVKVWNISNSALIKSITHTESVWSITMLPNGNLVSGLWDASINIWNLDTNHLIKNLTGHRNSICNYNCLHVLANGDLLSAKGGGIFEVWNLSNGKVRFTSSLHKYDTVYQLAFLPSGNLISASNRELNVWY
ncbi:WD-40 repeat [Brachionus plicatilis]|uniref:WD-40 repeat n=1 Tax=Brachionus plicatilis TaxID=10195 RepID=A0A3M7RI78_BRAPC|nr:WD-40 repeat [Brachionus plicatilis]